MCRQSRLRWLLERSMSARRRACALATLAASLVALGWPICAAAQITEFSIPTEGSSPFGIAAGPDGNLWFTEERSKKIGRITTGGTITEFPIGTSPYGISAGPGGNLWFTGWLGGKIGQITPGGAVSEFPIPERSEARARSH